jgi:hypothetical protein
MHRIIEEFVSGSLKTSTTISEVIFLGLSFCHQYYRKVLTCLITEFEDGH